MATFRCSFSKCKILFKVGGQGEEKDKEILFPEFSIHEPEMI